jgi:hypothetical protein
VRVATEPAVVQERETDRAVRILSERCPLVLRDVQEWIRLHPDAARFRATPAPTHASIRFAGRDFLFHPHHPEAAVRRLNAAPSQTLNHVFPNVATFLHFLAQPHAADCAASDRWQPLVLLPLQHAAHFQEYLSNIPPRDWPWLLLEPRHFLADESAAAQASSVAAQMIDWLGQMSRELGRSIAQLYADHPTPRQVLLARQRPLRVMPLAYEGSAYQRYCARDVVDGLLANGIDARACIASGTPAAEFEALQAIHDFKPDVLLLNGRQRGNLPPLPGNLCILSWDQDHALCPSPHYAKQAGPRDLLMVMVAEWAGIAGESGVTPTKLACINIGANPRVYHPQRAPHTECDYDVLFVGNIQPFEAYKKAIGFPELPPDAQQLMLHARARLAEWLAAERDDEHRPHVLPDCQELLRRSAAELGARGKWDQRHWTSLVHYFRYRIAHLLLREHFVSALLEFRLGLFGRGWEAFPRLASLARPEVTNGPELLDLIHRSAINLHLHTWTVHHPRLYDTAAAGGFLLVGRVPEQNPLESVFTLGEGGELDSFGSVAELKCKVRHYLSHPEERQAMAARAARRTLRDHTMDRRMAGLVEFLGKDVYGPQNA